MLTAKLDGHYRKQGGRVVFRHIVKGSKKELADYKQAQGENYREDENGNPLFFSPRYVADEFELTITTNGRVAANDLDIVIESQVEEEKAVRGELAKLLAQQQFEQRMSGRRTSIVRQPQAQTQTADPDDTDLGGENDPE